MKGGWIGQIIGVVWGSPTEFKFNDAIIPEDKVPAWTLWKTFDVSRTGAPKLSVTLANHGTGDFTFVARVNGKEVARHKISGEPPIWRTVTVDLAPYAGKTVSLELVNQPDGWFYEAAYWGEVEIKNAER